MTHPGARPLGPEFVERLDGSEHAKQRLKVFLKTMNDELTVPQACELLGIHETRFHVQRSEALQTALGSLEARPPGRRPHVVSPEEARIAELESQLRELQTDLQAAQIKLEHAQILRGDHAHVPLKKPGKKS